MTFVRTFLKEEQGQDLIEYSLLLAFIALASAALLTTMKTNISTIWTNSSTKLGEAAAASS